MNSSIVFTIGLFYYMYMNYKRLFLNWIKQRDPQNIFEFYLQRHGQTLKSHVKNSTHFHNLIMFNSFSWLDTIEGFSHWGQYECSCDCMMQHYCNFHHYSKKSNKWKNFWGMDSED